MAELQRCGWCEGDALYEAYHDNTIFEFLILETFQAGLSWITVLKKRENFRKAFNDFDYKEITNYSEEKLRIYCKIRELYGTN